MADRRGTRDGPLLQNRRAQDRTRPLQHDAGAPGRQHRAALGSVPRDLLDRWDHPGAFWLTRLAIQTHAAPTIKCCARLVLLGLSGTPPWDLDDGQTLLANTLRPGGRIHPR